MLGGMWQTGLSLALVSTKPSNRHFVNNFEKAGNLKGFLPFAIAMKHNKRYQAFSFEFLLGRIFSGAKGGRNNPFNLPHRIDGNNWLFVSRSHEATATTGRI